MIYLWASTSMTANHALSKGWLCLVGLDDKPKLPVGIVAFFTFLIGWAGTMLCMDQLYFVGSISTLSGDDGPTWDFSLDIVGVPCCFCLCGI